MSYIKIPYAAHTFAERDPPSKILHIVTKLPERPATPGYDANAQYEMMEAIGKTQGGLDGFDGYVG